MSFRRQTAVEIHWKFRVSSDSRYSGSPRGERCWGGVGLLAKGAIAKQRGVIDARTRGSRVVGLTRKLVIPVSTSSDGPRISAAASP